MANILKWFSIVQLQIIYLFNLQCYVPLTCGDISVIAVSLVKFSTKI